MRVAIQGEAGSFHHLAARRWYRQDLDVVPCRTFGDVFSRLADGTADQAVCAIENSLYGSINQVYDLLSRHGYPIVGELSERIHQNLIGLPGARLESITAVLSHPVALEQCADFITEQLPNAKRQDFYDTAGAVAAVQQANDPSQAAIGSSLAAELADLVVLAAKIENASQNYTRFVMIDPKSRLPSGANKASLVLRTSHKAGALYRALGIFADAGINLTKLQSRPIIGKVWKYQFYVDAEAAREQLQAAVNSLGEQSCQVSVLGEYVADNTEYED